MGYGDSNPKVCTKIGNQQLRKYIKKGDDIYFKVQRSSREGVAPNDWVGQFSRQ